MKTRQFVTRTTNMPTVASRRNPDVIEWYIGVMSRRFPYFNM